MKPEQVREINFRVRAQPDQQNPFEALTGLLHQNVGNETTASRKREACLVHHRNCVYTCTVQAGDGVFDNGLSKYFQPCNGTCGRLRAVSREGFVARWAQ
jgi:hypothetical protein